MYPILYIMSAIHLLSKPIDLQICNSPEILSHTYPKMTVMFSDDNIWLLSIQSNTQINQLSNSSDLSTPTSQLFLRGASNNGIFSTFINQSLLNNIDDTIPGSTSSYSSVKIEELINTITQNSFNVLQTGDILYDTMFKYSANQDTTGNVTFTVTALNSLFTDTTINFNNKFNNHDVLNISGLLSSPDDQKYTITCNVENLNDSFNNLSNPESIFELTQTKTINSCFNNLTTTLNIPESTTSVIGSFNNLICQDLTFTITDSTVIDMSTCFTDCSMNIVCLEFPLLVLDVSGSFENCSGNIVVMTDSASKPSHSTLNVVSAEELTLIEYTNTATNIITTYTFSELDKLIEDLNLKDHYTSYYNELELKIYGF